MEKMKMEYRKLRSESVKKFWDKKGRKGTIGKNGYRMFSIKKMGTMDRKYEHREIWEQNYGPIPKGYQIHHKDGNKLNNSIGNLEMLPNHLHLKKHAIENKLGWDRKGISPINKTSNEKINLILQFRKKGMFLKDIASKLNLSYVTVQKYAKELL